MTYERMAKRAGKLQWAGHQRPIGKRASRKAIRKLLREFGFTAHIRCRGEEAKALKKEAGEKARRWVVERAHSWLNRFRRLLVRWEKRCDTYVAMLHVSLGIITLRLSGSLEAA